MKKHLGLLLLTLILGSLIFMQCSDEEKTDENKKTFMDSVWTFNTTGDTIKDKIIGMWLSEEVSYDDQICYDCDSLFTWVIESTGNMVKRNNPSGDFETTYGTWTLGESKEYILFRWEFSGDFGACKGGSNLITDSIRIIYSVGNELWTSEYINYPPTTKMDIKFKKISM